MRKTFLWIFSAIFWSVISIGSGHGRKHRVNTVHQPLSRILVQHTVFSLHDSAYVKASPLVLGLKGQTSEWVTVEYYHPNPSENDWIGVFSPANFSAETCEPEVASQYPPYLCSAPIKMEGTSAEPMGTDSLQDLWQKYKVDLAFYGHVHNYERTCPVYQSQCQEDGLNFYTGPFTATTHVVVGSAGAYLTPFIKDDPVQWSFYRDFDFGFVKLTAFNHTTLRFENKKSSDGNVYDHFTISRDYKDVLACAFDSCLRTTLAT